MGMECLHCKCILLNVNVYGPIELKSPPHIFESVYSKWNVSLNGYFVFVYVLVNELGYQPGLGSDPLIRSGQEWGANLLVLELRFRCFWKKKRP